MTVSTFENPTIPWPLVPLKRVLRFRNGEPYAHVESNDGDYPVYGSGGEFARADDYLYDGTSVLFGRKGTVDKPMLVRGRFWCIDTMFYTRLDPSVDARFVHYFATTIPYTLLATDTARPSMTQTDLGEVKMPFPTLQEQRAIADFLDRETAQIDAMVEAQQALVEHLRERRRAALSDSMDGDSSLPRVPLRRLTKGITQGWSPQCEGTPVEDPSSEWAILKVGCVNGGVFRPEQNKLFPSDMEPRAELALRAGDLLMSRGNTRELVGSAAVVDKDYPTLMLSDLIYRVTLDDSLIDSAYVALALSTRMARDEIEMLAKGASHSMQKISQGDVRSSTIPLRSRQGQALVVAEAKEAAARTDTLISAAHRVIELLRERREALITAAVTGRIDPTTGIERIDPTTEEEAS